MNTIEAGTASSPGLSFPVVAVGASAGGLAAFTELLKALPVSTGMAFVLIQHLEPSHESVLTTLLSKATSMPVAEVSNGIAVEPNHVYVIPPNTNMTIDKGALRLAPRSESPGLQRPIDAFSVALAEEQGSAAIGVVLSGTGSDGTYGLKAIKGAGGVTFAQDPKTAQWSGMPLSAITAGSADFVLSPKRIAAELARIGRDPYLVGTPEILEGSDMERICQIVRAVAGVDFRLYRQATVRRRVARRMALQKLASLSRYVQILQQNPEEARTLADEIFIHVTSFFRDPECFEALRKRVLTKLCTGRMADNPIRVWVAGCSTGEEVYSIAMLLLEELGEHAHRIRIQIFGTDIQERAVEHARAGVYTEAAIAGVSKARLQSFFNETDHGYQIQKFVRDLCVFARHDLARDPPFSRLDLISCRNVLIYMEQALQKRVLSMFQYALKPGGFLFLGNSESIGEYSDAFTADDQKNRIFVRRAGLAAVRESQVFEDQFAPSGNPALRAVASGAAADFRAEAEAALLEHYAPAALIVDPDLRIVHFQGDMSPYLAPATGQPSFHLLKMVRPEFVVDLRTAINRARRDGVTVRKDRVEFKWQGRAAAVRLEVRPLKARADRKPDLLVLFQAIEPASARAEKKAGRGTGQTKPDAGKTAKLEEELAFTREHLRNLITEHETAQEEMKAASEEILSSNEELQSTNEELETAKEELQSSNEELVTLNDELQHRNAELNRLTVDLNNLLVGVDIAVLVLDADLNVRRFTPMAGALLNLIPGDVGRPFSDIAPNLDVADWDALFAEVITHGRPIERGVSDRGGHRYSLRVRPYKTDVNRIDGVLVVLFDIDTIKHALEEAGAAFDLARDAELRSREILNSLTAHIAVLNPEGIIVETNESWNLFAKENGVQDINAVGPGANYFEVCKKAEANGVPEARKILDGIQAVLSGDRSFFRLEFPCHSFAAQRWFLMNVSPLKGKSGGFVIAHTDITDRKLAEIVAKKGENTIQALLNSSVQSVVAVNPDGKIVLVNGITEKMFGYSREELLGQSLDILIPESFRGKHTEYHTAYFASMQPRPMGQGLDLAGRRKDGTIFPVDVGLSPVETASGKLGVAFVIDITQRKQLEAVAQAHAQQVQALAASLLTAQEDERRRVSRELHDQTCQELAALAIDIGGAAAQPRARDCQRRMKELQARVVKISEDTRQIAYELHPSVLDDLGLIASLRHLCKQFTERAPGVKVEFTEAALPASVSGEVASCLYRVAQESLQNITKHAKAKHVSVSLAFRNGIVGLTVVDDGVGFDPERISGPGGLGLVGMKERARLVNGKLSIVSRPGGGATISLQVPLPADVL